MQIRLLPNYNYDKNKVGDYSVPLEKYYKKYNKRQTVYFSMYYDYDTENIKITKYGSLLKDFISKCLTGYYYNSDNKLLCIKDHYLLEDKLYYYYIDEDGNIIMPYMIGGYDIKKLTKKRDIFLQEPINVFDIKCPKVIEYDYETLGNITYKTNLRLVDSVPLYKDGDDQEIFKSLYKNVIIEDYIEDYKKSCNDILFDNDSRLEWRRVNSKNNILSKVDSLKEMVEYHQKEYNESLDIEL